jgi:hypothetical protein
MANYRVLLIALVLLCAPALSSADGKGQHYLAHNLWFEKANSVSSIGYKRGTRIPAGTKVTDIAFSTGRHPGVTFRVPEWDVTLTVVVDKHQRKMLTTEELRDRMLTTASLDELTRGFNKLEKRAISGGYVATGMSKKAVIVTYGYPPKHKTPSTKSPTWIYWTSRLMTKRLDFDDKDRTTNGIGDPASQP